MLSSLALFGFVAAAVAQGITQSISPDEPTPPGCRTTDDTEFSITTINATTANPSRLVKRQSDMGALTIQLKNGVLTSNRGDTGYIAANYQFQFDSPPQTGAIYTAGFSICDNNILAIGGNKTFLSCISDASTTKPFSNLYSLQKEETEQCSEVFIQGIDGDSVPSSSSSSSSSSSTPSATVSSSATPTVAPATSAPVSSAAAAPSSISSIADGQPQAPTAAPTPTPSPVYAAGAPATGANLALAGAALLAAAML